VDETMGWAAFMSSMDAFRKDLKQIHHLEEEMSRVRRDREILVTRLIKSSKSRPTKSELAAMGSSYSQSNMSSRASSISVTSDGSAATKEGKRAGKLADAQAELLGCEEHLRGLEVRIEKERNKVMLRGLEERFRAMDAVGRMWVSQAKKGLADLDKAHGELSIPRRYRVVADKQTSLQTLSSSTRTVRSHPRNPPPRSALTMLDPPTVAFPRVFMVPTVPALSPVVSPRRKRGHRMTTHRAT
jgi:hypothetical protein